MDQFHCMEKLIVYCGWTSCAAWEISLSFISATVQTSIQHAVRSSFLFREILQQNKKF